MTNKVFANTRIVITGGTGSLGRRLTDRILSGRHGNPESVVIFSRDEARQHQMRLDYLQRRAATDDIIFQNFQDHLEFRIGDVRNVDSVAAVLREADIVLNAAAMKQVPTCEYFPFEATQTNIGGAENIVWAIESYDLPVETVVGISTDKACKPVNVMGMTKAVQERIFIQGNMRRPETRFVIVRYGNVLSSRGSVIPLFHDQIRNGGPVTITTSDMTRFLLSLDQAVDTVVAAVALAEPGEILVPDTPSALITNVADALIGDRDISVEITGIRPGEKVHEVLISDEEAPRTVRRGDWLAIRPMLPELSGRIDDPAFKGEFSSDGPLLDRDATLDLLRKHRLLVDQVLEDSGSMLR